MIRILQGDCRTVLATLPSNSVHCCVTSPPYFGLRSYLSDGHADKALELGLEPTPDAYVAELVAVFREVRRVLRDDGTLWLNLGDSYSSGNSGQRVRDTHGGFQPGLDTRTQGATSANPGRPPVSGTKPKDLLMMPARLALALQADGWWLRSDIIWHKPNPMPESVTDRPTSAHEHVFLLTKRATYFYDADAVKETASENTHPGYSSNGFKTIANAAEAGVRPSAFDGYRPSHRNMRNVWTIATAPYPEAHFATFPPELAERCIKSGTSERGACPACGAPWERILSDNAQPNAYGAGGGAKAEHSEAERLAGGLGRMDGGRRAVAGSTFNNNPAKRPPAPTTTGWRQTCACPAAAPVPCVVLDCFAGAFTAPMVADRLQRDAIGIELSETYCQMARDRLIKDAGMFAEIREAAE